MAELIYDHRGVQLYRGDALQEPNLWTFSPTPLFLLTDPPYGTNTRLRHRAKPETLNSPPSSGTKTL